MDFNLVSTAFAQSEPAKKGAAPIWPMLLAIFAVFYFFMIRPQQKKQKETKNMLGGITKGDKVVTVGGITGTIVNIKAKKNDKEGEDTVVLKVSDTTKIEFVRSSISRIVSKHGEAVQKS